MQRNTLSKAETDSVYLATTDVVEMLNKIKNNEVTPEDIETSLKELKRQATVEKILTLEEDFDIFGGMSNDSTKISKIKNKKHRELPKDKLAILDITKNTKQASYKANLEKTVENIKTALSKNIVPESLPIYKAINSEKLDDKKINVFNINPENEMNQVIKHEGNKINLYKNKRW